MNKKKTLICSILGVYYLILSFLLIPMVRKEQLVLFPTNQYIWQPASENDRTYGCFQTDSSKIQLFSNKAPTSYGGYALLDTLDIRGYHSIEVTIDTTTVDRMVLFLGVGSTDIELDSIPIIIHSNISIASHKKVILPIKDMVIPMWWYAHYAIHPKEPVIPNFRLGDMIGTTIDYYTSQDSSAFVQVSSVVLKKSPLRITLLFLTGISFPFILFSFISIIRRILRNHSENKIISSTNLTEISLKTAKEKVVIYIGTRYTLPELTIELVSKDLHIAVEDIEKIIAEEYRQDFRSYLNRVRGAEAARLLQNTDRQIQEIAQLVGYKHVAAFNRVFKDIYGSSPKVIRQQKRSVHPFSCFKIE